jgi:hypothetical protein
MKLNLISKILIACVIVLLVVSCINLYRSRHRTRKIVPFHKIKFGAGDLLLFKHRYMNPYVRLIFGDEFSHVGVVLEKDDGLYICEAVGEKSLYKLGDITDGIKISPLANRLKTYEGIVCVKTLNKPLSRKMKKLLNSYCVDNLNTKFCYFTSLHRIIIDTIKCTFNKKAEPSCASCSSFIKRLFINANLIDDKRLNIPYCSRPQLIPEILDSNLKFGYKYRELIEIKFDYE